MPNGNEQDPRATKAARLAQMKGAAPSGSDQPPQLSVSPQMSVATDPTLTSVLGNVHPGMPTWPGARGTDLDTALQRESLAQSQFGREQLTTEIDRLRGMTDEEARLRAQQAGLKTGYSPTFEPITGAKTLFRDIGRGALSVLGATAPGRAVENVLYAEPRRQYANKAEQIKNIRGQIEGEKEIVPAAASLAYHAPMSMARGVTAEAAQTRADAAQTTAGAAMMNAQTRQIAERHRYELEGKLLALKDKLGTGKLSEESKRTIVMQAKNLIDQDKNNAMREISTAHVDETERTNQLKAVEDAYKEQENHYLQTWFGVGATPPTYTPKSSPPPAGGGKRHVDFTR
jgi:hypothetical protein